jgi:hypothetical protein
MATLAPTVIHSLSVTVSYLVLLVVRSPVEERERKHPRCTATGMARSAQPPLTAYFLGRNTFAVDSGDGDDDLQLCKGEAAKTTSAW